MKEGRIPLKTLHLLRHAKATDIKPQGTDFERSLSKRGKAASKAVANHLVAEGFSVERVYCSPSQRTKETYYLIQDSLGGAKVSFKEKLYLIDAGELLNLISGLSNSISSALFIGHNPSLHMIALRLTYDAINEELSNLALMTTKFPTGALCSLRFDTDDWQTVKRGRGILTAFVRPKDLE